MRTGFILLILLLPGIPILAQYATKRDSLNISVEDATRVDTNGLYSFSLKYFLPIKISNKCQTLNVLFPQGGTSTTIDLYNEVNYFKYRDWMYGYVKRASAFMGECSNGLSLDFLDSIPLDLTDIEDGDYIARYVACGGYWTVKISLATE